MNGISFGIFYSGLGLICFPCLFILAAEVFSRGLTNLANMNLIEGIKVVVNAPMVIHLFFADDSMIFLKVDLMNVAGFIALLNQYSEMSGQRVNIDKSAIIFSPNINPRVEEEVCATLRIRSWDDPRKYLGLPAIWGRAKCHALRWVNEKIVAKLTSWKHQFLSQAGKEVLVKAMIQAIPSYVMSIVDIP